MWRQREHRAAGPVEVAGQHVEDVDEPGRDSAELGGRGADPPVYGGRWRGRQVPCEPRDRRAGMPQTRAATLGVKSASISGSSSSPATRSARTPTAPRSPLSTEPELRISRAMAASRYESVPGLTAR